MSIETGPLDALAALRGVLGLLDRIDPDRSQLAGDRRLAMVEAARLASRRLEALAVVLVAEADASDSARRLRGTPTTSWLALDPATDVKQAAGMVWAGKDLGEHAVVKEAALAGKVSTRQGRGIARALRHAPEGLDQQQTGLVAAELIAHAEDLTPSRTPRLLREAVQKVAPELASKETEQQRMESRARRVRARRHLRFSSDGDGGVDIRGNLPAVEAAGIISALEATMATRWRARRGAKDRLDLRDQSSPDQLRADALVALVTAPGRGSQQWGGGPGTQVFVTIRADELHDLAAGSGVLADGTELTAAELRQLCCEAALVPVVLGGDSEILDQGQARRLATPAIRRALIVRDRGCVFPGCAVPPEACEAHHALPHQRGGTCSVNNFVLLCPHHHALVEPARPGTVPQTDRWEVRLIGGLPEVIPPARVDPTRTPIRPRPG